MLSSFPRDIKHARADMPNRCAVAMSLVGGVLCSGCGRVATTSTRHPLSRPKSEHRRPPSCHTHVPSRQSAEAWSIHYQRCAQKGAGTHPRSGAIPVIPARLHGRLGAAAPGPGCCGCLAGWRGIAGGFLAHRTALVAARLGGCGSFLRRGQADQHDFVRNQDGLVLALLALTPGLLVDPPDDLETRALAQPLLGEFRLRAPGGDLMALGLLALFATAVGPAFLGVQAERRHRLAIRREAHVRSVADKPAELELIGLHV